MVAGSFFLTPATAIRYEKHDRRVQRMSKEEELGIGKSGRKVDMKEEYYVSIQIVFIDQSQIDQGQESVLMLGAETLCERLGRLGTETCQEASRRTRREAIIEIVNFDISGQNEKRKPIVPAESIGLTEINRPDSKFEHYIESW